MDSRWKSTVVVVLLSLLTVVCSSVVVVADFEPETGSAPATWSGDADGAGSQAGECGYFTAVKDVVWGSNVTAVSPSMFRGGAACGTCWDLKVPDSEPQYEVPVIRVVVTDVCRGGPCAAADKHFELSGHAFGALANRSLGHIVVTYTRVDCHYMGTRSAYRVDGSSTTENFVLTPMYIPGYETISVSLVHSRYNLDDAQLMRRVKGAVFQANATSLRDPPYTVYILYNDTTKFAGYQETLSLADGMIPQGWEPGHTYVAPEFPPAPLLP